MSNQHIIYYHNTITILFACFLTVTFTPNMRSDPRYPSNTSAASVLKKPDNK